MRLDEKFINKCKDYRNLFRKNCSILFGFC